MIKRNMLFIVVVENYNGQNYRADLVVHYKRSNIFLLGLIIIVNKIWNYLHGDIYVAKKPQVNRTHTCFFFVISEFKNNLF